MNRNINADLQKAQEGMLYHKKLVSMLEDLRDQKNTLEEKVEKLKEQFEKEESDVESLEGKSLSYIFYKILGNLDSKLEKEREEALAARLKYEQAFFDLKNVEKEIERLEQEEEKNRDWESVYQRLYNEKKEQLIASGSQTGEEILHLFQKITALKSFDKELREAIEAGESALTYLKSAAESLKSAENWGTWDLIGGGSISGIAKHIHIDKAKESVSDAQRKLSHFRSELADVKLIYDPSVDISDFAKFADIFFDGLFADWHMQSKIKASLESVERTSNQVNSVLLRLKDMKNNTMNEIQSLENKIDNLITDTNL